MVRITNAVLAEKIENLKEYIIERNDNQDERIALQEEKTEKNTISIAGIKGASAVIASAVSLFIAGLSMYLKKGQ
ncbi:hypothetical protein ES705_46618 [subsurface metagenome]